MSVARSAQHQLHRRFVMPSGNPVENTTDRIFSSNIDLQTIFPHPAIGIVPLLSDEVLSELPKYLGMQFGFPDDEQRPDQFALPKEITKFLFGFRVPPSLSEQESEQIAWIAENGIIWKPSDVSLSPAFNKWWGVKKHYQAPSTLPTSGIVLTFHQGFQGDELVELTLDEPCHHGSVSTYRRLAASILGKFFAPRRDLIPQQTSKGWSYAVGRLLHPSLKRLAEPGFRKITSKTHWISEEILDAEFRQFLNVPKGNLTDFLEWLLARDTTGNLPKGEKDAQIGPVDRVTNAIQLFQHRSAETTKEEFIEAGLVLSEEVIGHRHVPVGPSWLDIRTRIASEILRLAKQHHNDSLRDMEKRAKITNSYLGAITKLSKVPSLNILYQLSFEYDVPVQNFISAGRFRRRKGAPKSSEDLVPCLQRTMEELVKANPKFSVRQLLPNLAENHLPTLESLWMAAEQLEVPLTKLLP